MDVIQRSKDVVTGKSDLEHLFSLRKFPVFMGVTAQERNHDQCADLNFFISRESGAIQLSPVLPLDVVYQSSHGSGSIGSLWDLHHRSFAAFVQMSGASQILEIGGGHGRLATIATKDSDVLWTIVEPNPTALPTERIKVISAFFDQASIVPAEIDCVVHSHVIEHMYNPLEFLSLIAQKLPKNGHMVFSVPNMDEMLSRGYTNCLNFEHTVLLTPNGIEYLLSRAGFKILERQEFQEDHSLFFRCVKSEEHAHVAPQELLTGEYDSNRARFEAYVADHLKIVSTLNQIAETHEGDVFLFGAHVFSQYLLSFGLNENLLSGVLDNDSKKHGKRLYGTNLSVLPVEALSKLNSPCVFLRAGVYNEEIRTQIAELCSSAVIYS